MNEAETSKARSHHSGHRQRLRQRFAEGGDKALHDYELLELLLFSAIPRKDVKPLAKNLLQKFGSLGAVMNAPHNALTQIDGISENTATTIKTVCSIAERMMKQELMQKPILNNWTRLMDYCKMTMANEIREHFRILFLNKKNELIADEIQTSGTVDQTAAYPREIMKRSLELGATAIILMHNHPSGDPKPSKADIEMTNKIITAAQAFDISVHDHIIIAKSGYTSFRNEGLL